MKRPLPGRFWLPAPMVFVIPVAAAGVGLGGGVIFTLVATGAVTVVSSGYVVDRYFRLLGNTPVDEWEGEEKDIRAPPRGHIWVHRKGTNKYFLYCLTPAKETRVR